MVRYRRHFIAGGTFFFTVTLADRSSRALVDHIEALRAAVTQIRAAHPFTIDAIVVLPDHFHLVMTFLLLVADDKRPLLAGKGCGLSKSIEPHQTPIYGRRLEIRGERTFIVRDQQGRRSPAATTANSRSGSVGSGSTPFAITVISSDMSPMCISIRSSMGWSRVSVIGRILRFTAMSGAACCRKTGAEISRKIEGFSANAAPDPDFAALNPGYACYACCS